MGRGHEESSPARGGQMSVSFFTATWGFCEAKGSTPAQEGARDQKKISQYLIFTNTQYASHSFNASTILGSQLLPDNDKILNNQTTQCKVGNHTILEPRDR